jgi:hypothetical protein
MQPAACPADYGPLASRSRMKAMDGSIDHSSVYLYSSQTRTPARNDSAWASLLDANPTVASAIDSTAYLDMDFRQLYNWGPNSTGTSYGARAVT